MQRKGHYCTVWKFGGSKSLRGQACSQPRVLYVCPVSGASVLLPSPAAWAAILLSVSFSWAVGETEGFVSGADEKEKKFCWLQQLSSSHRKKRGAETKERTRELWSYLIRSTVWKKKKTETFSTLIWIWLSTTNAQKGRREVQVVRNVLWIKMYGKLLQRASWYKRHREREREETKSLKMMCTFLTAGLLVFCPPLHVSVVVCVCV